MKDGEVIIVDEFTGRLMPGRRWSDGLHQAVEAKEGVKIANENQTLASVTFQNYFRMYKKLGGMTGTADTEAGEFAKIYNLDVNVVPPNRTMIRQGLRRRGLPHGKRKVRRDRRRDQGVPRTGPAGPGRAQFRSRNQSGSPACLSRHGIKHNVLNAKQHEREAEIIAQAGRKGAVTIATNMAGRGTDILLGGNPDFMFKQVLYREESCPRSESSTSTKRSSAECDKDKKRSSISAACISSAQSGMRAAASTTSCAGRAGRQGDPGSSRFYLSLEDDLLRIFASERISQLMLKLGMEEGVPIEHGMVTRAIANAQKKVEAHNFEIRKQLLEYDDVMNKQREVIYQHRRAVLAGENLSGDVQEMIREVWSTPCSTSIAPKNNIPKNGI